MLRLSLRRACSAVGGGAGSEVPPVVGGAVAAANVPGAGLVTSSGAPPPTAASGGAYGSVRGLSTFNGGGNIDIVPGTLAPPVPISNVEKNLPALLEYEHKRLAERRSKLYDDMIVFEGGSIDDNESLGKLQIFRNFIHFWMYHKKWGYWPRTFRKYKDLTTSVFFDPIPFGSIRSEADYAEYVLKTNERAPTFVTPPALFSPYYGWVFAEYLIGVYRAKFTPNEPLVIYEVGAGTGAFAEQVLNFLAEFHPRIYDACEYHLIEMNPNQVQLQRNRLIHHYHRVKIHNISIHNWREVEPRRCFVVGISLLSSMPHDCVVWRPDGTCYEKWMAFLVQDDLSSNTDRFLQVRDPVILRYLRCLNWMREDTFHTLKVLCQTGGRENIDPVRYAELEPDLYESSSETISKIVNSINPYKTSYLPTAAFLMLETMAEYFPRHHALFADCNMVDAPLGGYNSPVVQAKYRVSKMLYLRKIGASLGENCGLTDILFPTNFDHLTTVYKAVCGADKEIVNMPHPKFWKTFGGEKTSIFTTKSGFNPMTSDYGDWSIFSTHHPSDR